MAYCQPNQFLLIKLGKQAIGKMVSAKLPEWTNC